MEQVTLPEWVCTGKSVRGASHLRNGLPNQDNIEYYQYSENGLPIILAVSDGHGSAKNFRSDKGSRLAVETATAVIKDFLDKNTIENFQAFKTQAQTELPTLLVQNWTLGVREHWEKNPFQDEEWKRLVQKDGEAAKLPIEKNPVIAYGATLLVAVVTKSFILYLQLGDGDILCVDSNDNVTIPIPPDPRLAANETTSLCMSKASREFRVELKEYTDNSPVLILLSTDGYANSFPSDQEFQQIGADYRRMIREQGIKRLEEQLEGFLNQTSHSGSGDDITLGIIKQLEPNDQDYQDYQEEVSDLNNNSSLDKKFLAITCFFTLLNTTLFVSFFLLYLTQSKPEQGQTKKTNVSEPKATQTLEIRPNRPNKPNR